MILNTFFARTKCALFVVRVDIEAELKRADSGDAVAMENRKSVRHSNQPAIPATVESSSE